MEGEIPSIMTDDKHMFLLYTMLTIMTSSVYYKNPQWVSIEHANTSVITNSN